MDLTGKTLWQVGAGDTERSYGEICIKSDIMIAGPGDPGPYDGMRYAYLDKTRQICLRKFCTEARRGDVVLLRLGTGNILAVGEIADEAAEWCDALSDVDGWDLQHVRRVRWFPGTNRIFPSKTLGSRVKLFSAMNVETVRTWVESLDILESERIREIAQLPSTVAPLDPAELGKRLFIEGLPSEHVDKLLATLNSIQRVASWYSNKRKRPEGRPSEQETICYLVIPLLLSLGWSQQTMAIQWNHVDVALFSEMPPTDKTLACVVEAKLLGCSVFYPLSQALNYALKPGREACDRLLVTDGIRYALYFRSGNGFSLKAYLNILKMREAYPVLGCDGAVQTILGMAH